MERQVEGLGASPIGVVLDETHWHRINAKVASHVFSLLASVEGTTVCLEIPLQSPPPPRETVTRRPSPPTPHPGDRRALIWEFARGGGLVVTAQGGACATGVMCLIVELHPLWEVDVRT